MEQGSTFPYFSLKFLQTELETGNLKKNEVLYAESERERERERERVLQSKNGFLNYEQRDTNQIFW